MTDILTITEDDARPTPPSFVGEPTPAVMRDVDLYTAWEWGYSTTPDTLQTERSAFLAAYGDDDAEALSNFEAGHKARANGQKRP